MLLRSGFLAGMGAMTVAATFPFPAPKSLAYHIDHDWTIPNIGNVRVVTFYKTPDRKMTQLTFALFRQHQACVSVVAPKPPNLRLLSVRSTAIQQHAPIAMSGGFATASRYPSGLLVVDGQIYNDVDTSFSGALVIDQLGALSVVPTAEIGTPTFAIQGRPLLIDPGGTMGIHAEDYRHDQRAYVAQAGDTIVMGTAMNMTLMQLAKLFLEHPDAFGVTKFDIALNLGGSVTGGFWAQVTPTTTVNDNGTTGSPNVLIVKPNLVDS